MLHKKKWHVLQTIDNSQLTIDKIIQTLLENRGLKTKKEIDSFLNPNLADVTVDTVGLEKKQLHKAVKRIQKAIAEKEQIVIFGDYDVDGITGTAILWETLHGLGAKVMPYIPDRIEEGYGLSVAGISNIKNQISKISLIITVDNGIVANDAVDFANENGIDVIITDHHTIGNALPNAHAIVHTTQLCGAGVAWLLSQEIRNKSQIQSQNNKNDVITRSGSDEAISSMNKIATPVPELTRNDVGNHLELVALATVADLVPLTQANRTLVKCGLKALRKTKRIGLLALFEEAQIDLAKIGVYEIGHIIGPRLNAMGRMANAMDSLRLLCTKDANRAMLLAEKLGRTNRERQLLTQELAEHAIERVKNQKSRIKNLLFLEHEIYEEGVIGLVAGKLVEYFYRPAIVVSKRSGMSKASARSIAGFNIIEFIRNSSHLLVNAGGHPMAAGFTVETEKLSLLQEALELLAEEKLNGDLLTRILRIDCELPLKMINQNLYDAIQQLAPFGMGNPEPVFVSRNVIVQDIRAIGAEGKHLKLKITNHKSQIAKNEELRFRNWDLGFDAIAFGMGELFGEIKIGDAIDIAYCIDENVWSGNKKLQLKIKDVRYIH